MQITSTSSKFSNSLSFRKELKGGTIETAKLRTDINWEHYRKIECYV